MAAAGTASYQWQKSSDNGATWTDCQGANVAVYEFTVSAETAGLYRCKVTAEGKIGTVSENVQDVYKRQEGKLEKLTKYAAVLFFVLALVLNIL